MCINILLPSFYSTPSVNWCISLFFVVSLTCFYFICPLVHRHPPPPFLSQSLVSKLNNCRTSFFIALHHSLTLLHFFYTTCIIKLFFSPFTVRPSILSLIWWFCQFHDVLDSTNNKHTHTRMRRNKLMESLCVMSQELPFLYLPPMFYDMKKDDEREKYQCAINNTKKNVLCSSSYLLTIIFCHFVLDTPNKQTKRENLRVRVKRSQWTFFGKTT